MKKLLIITLLLSPISFAETIECKTVAVHDGNTLTCLTRDKKRLKVRLWGIAAPELKQPFGKEARNALSKMTLNKDIVVQIRGENKYPRIIATVGGKEQCSEEELKRIDDEIRAEAISKNEPYQSYDIACYTYPNMNLAMVSDGYAWHNPFFKETPETQQTEDDLYYPDPIENTKNLEAEQKARSSKVGLWSLPNPTPPWIWKKRK